MSDKKRSKNEKPDIEEKLELIDIADIMKGSYINYAMSVIVSRALPDVRDGLKPVHRRVLYAMYKLSLTHDKPHKKSARIVGDIIGKYHPHGDSAAYETMVRMAQDFSLRYPLVDGHGNFGSIDGDSAAAMRYTEARLSPLAGELLRDINKNTIDYKPNFDGSEIEPVLLPSRIPNLLINGSSGIAVGMATNIPPHNLTEVINAVISLIHNNEITDDDLLKIVKGPDFPYGGIIVGKEGIEQAYKTGRGSITIRGKITIEEGDNGKPEIIIHEIPYGVNKPNLIEKIAELARENKIDDISDIRDESDRFGLRIVVEIKRNANPNKIIKDLYKMTSLETTFGVNNLALVNGVPEVLTLKEILQHYLDFQREVIDRRTRFELEKAEKSAHLLQGFSIVGNNLDEVISLIKSSRNPQSAKNKLMKTYKLSEIQAQAVLDLRLHRLTSLELSNIEKDLRDTLKLIKELKDILNDQKLVDSIIERELREILDKYGDERRTVIVNNTEDTDLVDGEILSKTVIVSISNKGYVYSVNEALYSRQARGSKGSNGLNLSDNDFITHTFSCRKDQVIGLFTMEGNLYKIKVSDIPESGRTNRGTLIYNLLPVNTETKIASFVLFSEEDHNNALLFTTQQGFIKKLMIEEVASSRNGVLAIKLKKDDQLLSVFASNENENIIVTTKKGKAIHFNTQDIRPMGRVAAGVSIMKLDKGDYIVSANISSENTYLLTMTENGYGKKTNIDEYRVQNRGGKGVIVSTFEKKKGDFIGSQIVQDNQDILISTLNGRIIRLNVDDIALMTRATSGGKIVELDEGDSIYGITPLSIEDNEK